MMPAAAPAPVPIFAVALVNTPTTVAVAVPARAVELLIDGLVSIVVVVVVVAVENRVATVVPLHDLALVHKDAQKLFSMHISCV